jgi:hypothetical protein
MNFRPFVIAAMLLLELPLAHASAPAVDTTDRDTKNEKCAQLAIAAKEGRTVEKEDPRLAACAAASRTVCKQTREILEGASSTRGKDLLPGCSGPEQVALSGGQIAAACKLGVFVLNACVNGLPTTPTIKDAYRAAPIIRIAPNPVSIGGN